MRRKLPYVPQPEVTACGAACLAMVLGFHGRHVDLRELEAARGGPRDGVSALDLLGAAREQGLEARGVKAEVRQLQQCPLPAILHWDFNHFLVLARASERGARLVDPACGWVGMGWEELGRHFTGVALLFAPGPDFRKRRRAWPSLEKYREAFRDARAGLVQLFLAALALQAVGLVFPVAQQVLIDRVLVPRQAPWLWGLGLGLGLAILARTLLTCLQGWVALGLQADLDQRLMSALFRHLLRLPLGFFLQRQTGDLAQRFQGTGVLRHVLGDQAVLTLLNGLLLLGYGGLMLAYHARLGLLVLGFGVMRAGVVLPLRARQRRLLGAELAAAGREASAVLEAVTGLEWSRACAAGPRLLRRWDQRLAARVELGQARLRLNLGADGALSLGQGGAGAAILLLGGRAVLAHELTLGVFMAFLTLEGLFLGALEALLAAARPLQDLGCHLRRLDEVLETPAEPSGSGAPGRLRGALACRGVTFRASRGGPLILDGITLTLRPGEHVAVTGPSGAGKSTLVRLLLGLEVPEAGDIRYDGRELSGLSLPELRGQVGVALQEAFLFDDTVRANLALYAPDLPLARLRWAARMACVEEVILALPGGFDCRVGEHGGFLSGGQRQRLCLARALARDPGLLLLDEATSSLDPETEGRIQANLARLGRTRLVISHRLATLEAADRILVMAGGRIVLEGTPAELRRSGALEALLPCAEAPNA